MKVYETIILIIIAIIFSVGAVKIPAQTKIKEQIAETEYRFLPIQKWESNAVVYDTKTGVEYFVMDGSMTLLVDADGKPLLYQGE